MTQADNILTSANKRSVSLHSTPSSDDKAYSHLDPEAGVAADEKKSSAPSIHNDVLDNLAGDTLKGRHDPIGGLMPDEGVRQGLNQRHLQMLALAGAIGTGLFLSTGKALQRAGPVGILISYSTVGTIVMGMILSLAELSALAPTSGSYIRHAKMFADEALGASVGWNLAAGSAISIPGEIVACYVLVQFWTGDSLNPAIFITIFAILILLTNLLLVRIYGEVEFCFSMLKITLIAGLIIFGIAVDLGAGEGGVIGFRYWKDPGPFSEYLVSGPSGAFVGFWYTLTGCAYAFAGVESVAMAAAETKSPRQNIPKAARRTFVRIIVLYILSLFVVSLIVSSKDPLLVNSSGTASQSPFVIAASRAGIHSVASLINAVVLTSAWSSANHGILSGSRALLGLALDGNAPKIFLKTHRWGVPWVGVVSIAIFMTLAYMTVSTSGSIVFGWFQSLTAASTLWQWITICITYLRLFYGMRVQGIDRSALPYRSPWQPYLAWWSLGGSIVILVTGGFTVFLHGHWSLQDFFSAYFFPIFNLACYIFFKVLRRTPVVPLSKVPIQPWLDDYAQNPEEPLKKPRGWRRFVFFLWS